MLWEWNDTAAGEPAGSVVELFEAWAARRPEALALICEDEQLSYRELDARANRLAHALRRWGPR